MAKFVEETNVEKIAKALIVNRGHLWVLACGDYKEPTRHCVLGKIRALGIEPESQLYSDIDYSICTKESIKDRPIRWNHNIIICNIDGLINDITGAVCAKTFVNTIRS